MIFGKSISEYYQFAKGMLGLIVLVGIVRLALSLGGVPNSTTRWVSITAVMWIGILYFAVRVHTSGFGTYKHLLPICFLQSVAVQVIVVPAIVLAIFTGHDNIYTVPEYSFGSDGKTWLHAAAHLFVGTTIGTLVGWIVGCLIMLITKKLMSRGRGSKAPAHA
jgi:hypothetical protein